MYTLLPILPSYSQADRTYPISLPESQCPKQQGKQDTPIRCARVKMRHRIVQHKDTTKPCKSQYGNMKDVNVYVP